MLFPFAQGARSVAKKVAEELLIEIEETRAALHDSIERAKELVCEARQVMLQHREEPEPAEVAPPEPAA